MKRTFIILAIVGLALLPDSTAFAGLVCKTTTAFGGTVECVNDPSAPDSFNGIPSGSGTSNAPSTKPAAPTTGSASTPSTGTGTSGSGGGSLPNGSIGHTTGGTTGGLGSAAGGLAGAATGKAGCAAAGAAGSAGSVITAAQQAFGIGQQVTGITGAGSGEVPVIDHSNLTENTITARNETIQTTKECILDGLVVSIREALIAAITQSIIDWINNGFEGAPSFITNFSSFLGQIADSVSLNFIQGSELGFLCSPFQLQVRLSLSVAQRPFTQRVQCSLGDVTRNIEGFLGGDFSQGGFPALFKLALDVQNNPYGAYLLSKNELDVRIQSAESAEIAKLNWGQGMRDHGKCVGATGSNVVPPTTESECSAIGGHWQTDTIGYVINEQLNNTLGSGQRQLELADEIDEIISALLAQLAQKALTAIGGLSGLSSRSSGSASDGQSYLDQLTAATGADATASAHDVLVMQVTGAISLESSVQSAVNATNSILAEEKNLLSARYQCYTNVNNLSSATTASSTIATINTTLSTNRSVIVAAANAINTLIDIVAQADSAPTAEAVNAASNRYDALAQSGSLHTAGDLTAYERARDTEQAALDTLKAQTSLSGQGDACLTQTTQ